MRKVVCINLILLFLAIGACSSDGSRYQDNTSLERPPENPANTTVAEKANPDEPQPPVRRHGKGLKSDVYRQEGSSASFVIKRQFDETWSLLKQAIHYNELKITDQDRSKGTLYVAFGESGFWGLSSLLTNENDPPIYMLKVEPEETETKVTITQASKNEQSDPSRLKDGMAAYEPKDESRALLDSIFEALQDHVKDE